MADTEHWSFPPDLQPRADDVDFDLKRTFDSVVHLHAEIPEDGFTASILGTDRTGSGAVIDDSGLILTIGYLIAEASSVWITTQSGKVLPGHVLAYDFATGLGLVQPLGQLALPAFERGSAAGVGVEDRVYVIGHGGRAHALKSRVIVKREFAGYWEYLLDEALFTAPAHPEWSGAALLDDAGRLIGIGSLLVQEAVDDNMVQGNMFVPVDVLEPVLPDLVRYGRSTQPVRPWLGVYAVEMENRVLVNGMTKGGPADRAGLRVGDIIKEVDNTPVRTLSELFRGAWRIGPAGTTIPLTIERQKSALQVRLESTDRASMLKKPQLQ